MPVGLFWSGIRESNPPPQLGKLMHYRCANAACIETAKVLLLFDLCKSVAIILFVRHKKTCLKRAQNVFFMVSSNKISSNPQHYASLFVFFLLLLISCPLFSRTIFITIFLLFIIICHCHQIIFHSEFRIIHFIFRRNNLE